LKIIESNILKWRAAHQHDAQCNHSKRQNQIQPAQENGSASQSRRLGGGRICLPGSDRSRANEKIMERTDR
jgi:hypothetical protein